MDVTRKCVGLAVRSGCVKGRNDARDEGWQLRGTVRTDAERERESKSRRLPGKQANVLKES